MRMPLPEPSRDDQDLQRRVLQGDEAAADTLFGRHLDSLYEFVHYRVGGDRAQAEDVVQDTMLVALDQLAKFDGRSTLHTWLCGIAKHKIRALRRKRRPRLVADLLDESDGEIDAILSTVDSEPLPDWVLERRETEELVGATLSSLPPDYRNVLVQKYIDGLTVGEIASTCGKGNKAAESTLHRARLAFSRIFKLLSLRRGGLE